MTNWNHYCFAEYKISIFNFHGYSFPCLNCNVPMTVAMGRRYFPHCSEVLDKFMDDDLPDLFYLERGTQHEQKIKRRRFMELKEDVQKAFNKDKAERSGLSSSSSKKDSINYQLRKLWCPVKFIVNNRGKTLFCIQHPSWDLSQRNDLILMTAYQKVIFSLLWGDIHIVKLLLGLFTWIFAEVCSW